MCLDVQRLTIQLQLYFIKQFGIERRFWGFSELLDVSLELLEAVNRYFLHCSKLALRSLQDTSWQITLDGSRPQLQQSRDQVLQNVQEERARYGGHLQQGREQELEDPPQPGSIWDRQQERSAANEESASTYERRWHDSFVNGRRGYSLVSEGAHGQLFALGLMEAEMSNPALTAPINFTHFLPTKFTPPAPATPPTQIVSLMSSQRELPLSPKSTRKLNAQRKVQPLTKRIYQLSSLTHKSRTGRLPGKSTISSTSSRSKQRYHL